jgi:hypothetical protein
MSINSYIRRQFQNAVSVSAVLGVGGMSNSASSFTLNDGSTFPDGGTGPFMVVIDQGTALEEKIQCASRSGNTCTVNTNGRAYNGSGSAQTHAAGASVLHVIDAQDMDEANQVVVQTLGAIAAAGDLLVGSAANTLIKLAKGATNSFLQAGAGGLQWTGFGVGRSQKLGSAVADGTDTTPARSDHVHALAAADSTTSTFTNKRITRRITSTASSATPTINTDNTDLFEITALAANITSMTTNLSGTPVDGDLLEIRITDNGTARSIVWGTGFESSPAAPLPATTTISVALSVFFQYNGVTSKWRSYDADLAVLPGVLSATVATSETTTSLTYTDLTTPGPAVSPVTGTSAMVIVSAQLGSNTASDGGAMAFAVSGATTVAATDAQCMSNHVGNTSQQGSAVYVVTGLTPGVNTFTAKYRATLGGTCTAINRQITVIPLP